jgi:hypothetical protein
VPYWDDWIKRDSRFPLPAEVGRLLSTEEEVRIALAKGADPVALSIVKWRRIGEAIRAIGSIPLPLSYLQDLARYIGYRTCALCIDSASRYEATHAVVRYGSDKCTVCPLSAVDQCTREGSVFRRLERLLQDPPLGVPGEVEAALLGEIAHLQREMEGNLRKLAAARRASTG